MARVWGGLLPELGSLGALIEPALDRHRLAMAVRASFGRLGSLRVLSLSCNAGRERCLPPLPDGTWLTLPSPGCWQAASVGVVAGEHAT